MAHQENTDPPAHAPAEESQELVGYTALPNLLLQELGGQHGSTYSVVLFIARHTIGRQIKLGSSYYRVKTVCLSFDEFLHGRHKRDGTRMQPPSGLSDDKAIMRGCQAALAQGLIEVGEATGTRGVRLYSIPARFWLSAGFSAAIQMLADPRVPSSFTAYRLVSLDEGPGPTAGKTPAVHETVPSLTAGVLPADRGDFDQVQASTAGILPADRATSDLAHASTAGKILADVPSEPHKTAVLPASTAGKSAAVGGQNASSTVGKMPADVSGQPNQEAACGERKHSNKHRKVNIDRSYDTIELQNAMQKKAENTNTTICEESITTQPDLPDSSAALASRQASLESTGVCLHPPPDHAPPAAGEEVADLAARRLRLLALQQELAQLKRTPSMQLLARQRIPRLEEAIKHLIASLAESA